MMINKAYTFRIYPNQAQAILINKTIGCSRFVFNHFLSLWNHAYKETGQGLTYGTCSAKLPAIWLRYYVIGPIELLLRRFTYWVKIPNVKRGI